MKEDKLKQLWNLTAQTSDFFYENNIKSDLNKITKSKSKNIMEKVKRNFKLGIAFAFIFTFILAYFMELSNPIHLGILSVVLISIIAEIFVLKKLYNSDLNYDHISDSLSSQINILKNYIRVSKISSIIIVPLALYVIFHVVGIQIYQVDIQMPLSSLSIVSILTIVWVFIAMDKIYGTRLKELINLLDNLNMDSE